MPRRCAIRLGLALLGLLALAGALIGAAAAPAKAEFPPIVLKDDSGRVKVRYRVDFLRDPRGAMTIADVTAAEAKSRFVQKRDGPVSFGFSEAAFWVRFTLANRTTGQSRWMLEVEHPTLDRVDVYVPDGSGGLAHHVAGDTVPASKRPLRHRNLVFPFTMPPGATRTIYVRVESGGPVRLPMVVQTPAQLSAWDRIAQIAFGFNYGVVFVMALYNILLFFSVRDRTHLYFAGFMLSFGVIQMFINGHVFALLWPEATYLINTGVTVFINVAAIAVFYFARHLLDTRRTAPWIDAGMRYASLFAAALVPLAFFSNMVAIRLSYLTMFITVTGLILAGVLTWRKKVRQAPFFLVAWSVFLIGILLIALTHLGFLPDTFFTNFTIQIGSMVTAMLLSYSVADRIKGMREAKERELQNSEARYALAMDGAREGLWDWDIAAGRVFLSGRQIDEFRLGDRIRETTVPPRRWLAVIEPEDRRPYLAAMRAHLAGAVPAFECEYRVRGADGVVRWVFDRGVALRDNRGRAYRMAGSMGNITTLKDKEQELREARDHAEMANRAKSEFLARMSHELRTPLNAIIGFSEMMISQSLGPIGNSKYADYASDIRDSGAHLLDLINDILDVSKVEAGRMDLYERTVKLGELIESSIQLVRTRATDEKIELSVLVPADMPALKADKRALKQILLNLLSNAVKFTQAGGRVTVKAALDRHGGIVLSVIDTGVGIPQADLERVLEPFTQLESSMSRHYEGSGLGLALARSLAELHGAELDLMSEEGAGTIVSVRFPKERTLREAEPAPPPALSQPPAPSPPPAPAESAPSGKTPSSEPPSVSVPAAAAPAAAPRVAVRPAVYPKPVVRRISDQAPPDRPPAMAAVDAGSSKSPIPAARSTAAPRDAMRPPGDGRAARPGDLPNYARADAGRRPPSPPVVPLRRPPPPGSPGKVPPPADAPAPRRPGRDAVAVLAGLPLPEDDLIPDGMIAAEPSAGMPSSEEDAPPPVGGSARARRGG